MDGLSASGLIWITRANPGASRTGERLRALGFAPLAAPLIETRDLPGPPPDLANAAAIAFTSARGVKAFVDRAPPPPLPVFTVGDATAEAARAAGFTDVCSASGAGRDLLRLILGKVSPGGEVLCAGAREPAFDLVAALKLAGRSARALALYETLACDRLPEVAQAALNAETVSAVLIHSPAAANALAACLRTEPNRLAAAHLVALSADCARPLAHTPFATVHIAKTPDEPSLLDALLGAGLPRS